MASRGSEYRRLVRNVKERYQWVSETVTNVIVVAALILVALIFFQNNLNNFFLASALSVLLSTVVTIFFSCITILNEESYVSNCVNRLKEFDSVAINKIQSRAAININTTLTFTFLPNVFLIFFLAAIPRALDTFNSSNIPNISDALIGSFIVLFLIIVSMVVFYTQFMIRRAHINTIIQHACIEYMEGLSSKENVAE